MKYLCHELWQDEGSFPLLTDDWGAIEEVLLLDAVEQDGFGNWYVCKENYVVMYCATL